MLNVVKKNVSTTVYIPDDFDAHLAESLKNEFVNIADDADRDVVLDLTACDFIDSSGIGAIIFLRKRLICKGYHLFLTRLNQQPLELMKLLKIDQIIKIKK